MTAAWEALKESIVYFRGQLIGTVAAVNESQEELNYDQVFMRDFVPSALAFLMKAEPLIMKNFLLETARLQSGEKMVDLFKLGQGVMPASFKVHHPHPTIETLLADFGEFAIGRVAPVDSGLWWIFLLNAYTTYTKDKSLSESPHCQRAMRLILKLWLSEGSDTSTVLLCSDGCSMIDRRMGIYGYPLEIQALFFMALGYMSNLLLKDSDDDFRYQISKRIKALSYHLQSYYWLDFQRLNDIYRYKTEEYLETALNKFNVIPESIPDWIFDSMPSCGGYFIGNVSPARMDFRWFCLGKFIGIMSSPATGKQVEPILDRVEECWEELIGEMPLKICYPGVKNQEGQRVTGCLPKNGGTNDDLLSRRKGLVKSAATYSGSSVTGHAKTMKKSCHSAPSSYCTQLVILLLLMLSTSGFASASTRHTCEVASLATNIRLFCSSNHPTSLCCDSINAAAAIQDGRTCLCLVGNSPDILAMGFSAKNLISLHNICAQHEDEYDCDNGTDDHELRHERTGGRESVGDADDDHPHHRNTHKPDKKDGVSEENQDSTEGDHPHRRKNHKPDKKDGDLEEGDKTDHPKRAHKSDTHDRDSKRKEASEGQQEASKKHDSKEYLQPYQHNRPEPHTNNWIISFLAGLIGLLLVAVPVTALVIKYKQQRTDLRQLLSVALATALAQVRAQDPVAAQDTLPVEAPPRPVEAPQTVDGLPVPPLQAQPPFAMFPGPLDAVSMLAYIALERVRRRIWASAV